MTLVPDWFYDLLGRPKSIEDLPGPPLGESYKAICNVSDDFIKTLWLILTKGCWLSISDESVYSMPGQYGLYNEQTYIKQGPQLNSCDIVIIGKHPGRTEHETGYIYSEYIGEELFKVLKEAKLENFFDNCYITNLCKFYPPEKNLKQKWIRECAWLLWAELAIIKPKFLLLFGSEVIKYFHGNRATVSKYRGTVLPYELHISDTEKILINTFSTLNPGAAIKDPGVRVDLISDLIRFSNIYSGTAGQKTVVNYLDSNGNLQSEAILDTVEKVKAFVQERLEQEDHIFALDCEWAGKSPYAGGTLLTIQISWAPGQAVLIPIHRNLKLNSHSARGTIFEKLNEVVNKAIGEIKKLDFKANKNNTGLSSKLSFSFNNFDFSLHALEEGYFLAVELKNNANEKKINKYNIFLDKDTFEATLLNYLEPIFNQKDLIEVISVLNTLFMRPGVQVGGHSFRNDFHWLKRFGLNLIDQYLNGFDTILQHHCLYESAPQDLSSVMMKFTDVPRYDFRVETWAKVTNVDKQSGYGLIPEKVLYPYALLDVDVTFRLFEALTEKLEEESTRRPNIKDLYKITLNASAAILEMEENGINVDRDRIIYLATIYKNKLKELEQEFIKLIRWPDFNFRSIFHVRELLFGEKYNGKVSDSGPHRLRPEGAHCCYLTPIKTTDRPPKSWEAVIASGLEDKAVPAADKEVLGILSEQDEIANKLRQLRFLDQVCKMYVALPDENGDVSKGLLQHIDPDGRIRTSIIQTLETGRWASRNPNLQNLPKRREPELHSLFSEDSKPYKIRSIFVASPGHVLIESDFEQAELIVLALLSGDKAFWTALTEQKELFVLVEKETGKIKYWLHPDWTRNLINLIPKSLVPSGTIIGEYFNGQCYLPLKLDVDCVVDVLKWKRDLHAERAITGFKLDYCAVIHGPPKNFVNSRVPHLRVAAKTVNFGIPYGRGARAIARELEQEGVRISVEECQSVIDSFYSDFPDVKRFLDICKYNARTLGYIITPFGRCRHFVEINDKGLMLSQEREACNFPIQGTVADCLNQAAFNLWLMKKLAPKHGVDIYYRLLLGIHDALLIETTPRYLKNLIEPGGIIDMCMGKLAPIPFPDRKICNGLYANVNPDLFPFSLSVDKTVSLRWDEKASKEDLMKVGVAEELIDDLV